MGWARWLWAGRDVELRTVRGLGQPRLGGSLGASLGRRSTAGAAVIVVRPGRGNQLRSSGRSVATTRRSGGERLGSVFLLVLLLLLPPPLVAVGKRFLHLGPRLL